jgi:ABC-type proline/glycine betaine transport system ATPase subunit
MILLIMLNLNKEGRPYCKIIGGKYNNQIISVSEKSDEGEGFKSLAIANDAKFQLVPNPKTEREILYITGPSGSGKSTFVRKYLEAI